MTGERIFLTNLKLVRVGKVTFGDSVVGKIIGKGKLNFQGLPSLDDVMLVEELTANLINISQLCDQGLKVSFTKEQCVVTNNVKTLVMTGTRSSDNYYLWNPHSVSSIYHLSRQNEASL